VVERVVAEPAAGAPRDRDGQLHSFRCLPTLLVFSEHERRLLLRVLRQSPSVYVDSAGWRSGELIARSGPGSSYFTVYGRMGQSCE
jgi:hypothetical protein